ncbi:hypothetical protein BS47DRAFT_617608 [Hydnum rufescens UP504]|uniref:Uncharacterized protein n=1 Tax=Hydnum rufescens UP504 TaxID=1448309 RepID=A0A9P6DZE0_9AGAM|nr:hypothetical protein BS47DRAFT_617608 [Hydnum rufescens UP504]
MVYPSCLGFFLCGSAVVLLTAREERLRSPLPRHFSARPRFIFEYLRGRTIADNEALYRIRSRTSTEAFCDVTPIQVSKAKLY